MQYEDENNLYDGNINVGFAIVNAIAIILIPCSIFYGIGVFYPEFSVYSKCAVTIFIIIVAAIVITSFRKIYSNINKNVNK